ncbi:MAG: sigma-70 family RNA polymerase sigma factor [bacterium]|nr:sigma-70 family RNA polymerase sigma factor [bacterium]
MSAERPDENTKGDEIQIPDIRLEAVPDFEVFYRRNHAGVCRALTLTLNNVELAQDAAAEAMTRAYQRWNSVGKYQNPAGWVYRVGLNWARSRLRKILRRPLPQSRPTEDIALGVVNQMDHALEQLSVGQRSVVVLRYYLDWSERQIADALNIAPGTVKSRLSRALHRLEDLLEDPYGN